MSQNRKPQAGPSIVMYAGDLLGLGHLRRTTHIASRLVHEQPGCSVLLLTGVPSGCFFELPEGVDFVKLPSVRKVGPGEYAPRSLAVSMQQVKRLRTALIQEAVDSMKPDLLLVDHTPVGLWGELLPALEQIRRQTKPASVVLGLRDVLDAPEVTRNLWHANGSFQAIARHYDSVLIYGAEEIFDTARRYGLDQEVCKPVQYCGYICSGEPRAGGRKFRRDWDLGDGPVVALTAGGGADGYPMMAKCLAAIRELGHRADFQVVCVTGPFMSRGQREALREHAAGLPVRIHWCVEEGPGFLDAADLVVCMAGYNTLMEAIRARKRILALPRSGPSAEQQIRSSLYGRLGLLHDAGPQALTTARLGELIRETLASPAPESMLPRLDGVSTVVRHLQGCLEQQRREAMALSASTRA
jgi:predicted glycosyltransferase